MPLRSSTASTATSGISMSSMHPRVPSAARRASRSSRRARSEAAAQMPRLWRDSSEGARAGVERVFFATSGYSSSGSPQGRNASTSVEGSKSERSESSR